MLRKSAHQMTASVLQRMVRLLYILLEILPDMVWIVLYRALWMIVLLQR